MKKIAIAIAALAVAASSLLVAPVAMASEGHGGDDCKARSKDDCKPPVVVPPVVVPPVVVAPSAPVAPKKSAAPIMQAYSIPWYDPCPADFTPAWAAWPGAPEGGWGKSWAQWPNHGLGGTVCERSIVYSDSAKAWVLAK